MALPKLRTRNHRLIDHEAYHLVLVALGQLQLAHHLSDCFFQFEVQDELIKLLDESFGAREIT